MKIETGNLPEWGKPTGSTQGNQWKRGTARAESDNPKISRDAADCRALCKSPQPISRLPSPTAHRSPTANSLFRDFMDVLTMLEL